MRIGSAVATRPMRVTPRNLFISRLTSILCQSDSGEDLPALRQIPVAERRRRHARTGGPRAPAQRLVAVAEEDLRVLPVGMGLEAGVAAEVARGPLPYVAEHAQHAVRRRSIWQRAGGYRLECDV